MKDCINDVVPLPPFLAVGYFNFESECFEVREGGCASDGVFPVEWLTFASDGGAVLTGAVIEVGAGDCFN